MKASLALLGGLSTLLLVASGPGRQARFPVLAELHLHGPLSEGTASVLHHVDEGVRHGYDLLWWTDHRRRLQARFFRTRVDFEGSLQTSTVYPGLLDPLINEFVFSETQVGSTTIDFEAPGSVEGAEHAEVSLQAGAGGAWTQAELVLDNQRKLEKKSLLALPRPRIYVRPDTFDPANAGLILRVVLSAQPDGVTEDGIPNLLEYVPSNMTVPQPASNVVRVALPAVELGAWSEFVLDPGVDAAAFPEGIDQSFYGFEILLVARSGANLTVDLDGFEVDLTGPTDLELLNVFADRLQTLYADDIAHEVGLELGGPDGQVLPDAATGSDHLIALFPDGPPPPFSGAFATTTGDLATPYPAGAVESIQARGGVAILAHVFGTGRPPTRKSDEDAAVLADRVIDNQAWGADALEVGYPDRERPLRDFLDTWDTLSSNRVYVTGVGSSDNHNVEPWNQIFNNWGSWIRTESMEADDLVAAVREGQLFLGSPYRFDPDGDLVFEAADGSFAMGDVVPVASGTQDFQVELEGAPSGDTLDVLHNGQVVSSFAVDDASYAVGFSLAVQPGDWVRLELTSGGPIPYLLSNPIYFIEEAGTPPPHRSPGR